MIDVDHGGADYAVSTHATWDLEAGSPGPLVYQRPELGAIEVSSAAPAVAFACSTATAGCSRMPEA